MPSHLTHRVLPAGEILVGDVFVDEAYHDSLLWGQTVTAVIFVDRPCDQCGVAYDVHPVGNGISQCPGDFPDRLVSIKLTGHCGLLTGEAKLLEVLREDDTVVRVTCSCGARLVLATTSPEPVGKIVFDPECPSCGNDVELPVTDDAPTASDFATMTCSVCGWTCAVHATGKCSNCGTTESV